MCYRSINKTICRIVWIFACVAVRRSVVKCWRRCCNETKWITNKFHNFYIKSHIYTNESYHVCFRPNSSSKQPAKWARLTLSKQITQNKLAHTNPVIQFVIPQEEVYYWNSKKVSIERGLSLLSFIERLLKLNSIEIG